MKCELCGGPIDEWTRTCDWTIQKPTAIYAGKLERGDIVFRRSHPDRTAKILLMEPYLYAMNASLIRFVLSIRRKSGRPTSKEFHWDRTAIINVFREAPCGKICCIGCYRELSESKFVCSEHWHEMEKTA